MKLACSGYMVNHSGKNKHCHFCLPECTQPEPDALQTLSQDPCPTGKPPMDLKPTKSKEANHMVKNAGSVVMTTFSMNLWFEKILPYLVLVIFHVNSGQVDNQATAPSRDQPAEPPQALYCTPGAPFGTVHFTEYPPNPAYLEYNLEIILIADLLERTRETKYIGCEGKKIEILSCLASGDNIRRTQRKIFIKKV
ncbi:hypothetical protein DSO57_1027418 [Entomophthora muscae]|uniref:Uncharacterized protein n=1 Tax=Entomophthora muscae TaxID=34485 RepID=A0ACC2SR63_9FUNG|nr:hypothetical protein DSO57_1027418 [Entomophthora muscae]